MKLEIDSGLFNRVCGFGVFGSKVLEKVLNIFCMNFFGRFLVMNIICVWWLLFG